MTSTGNIFCYKLSYCCLYAHNMFVPLLHYILLAFLSIFSPIFLKTGLLCKQLSSLTGVFFSHQISNKVSTFSALQIDVPQLLLLFSLAFGEGSKKEFCSFVSISTPLPIHYSGLLHCVYTKSKKKIVRFRSCSHLPIRVELK